MLLATNPNFLADLGRILIEYRIEMMKEASIVTRQDDSIEASTDAPESTRPGNNTAGKYQKQE